MCDCLGAGLPGTDSFLGCSLGLARPELLCLKGRRVYAMGTCLRVHLSKRPVAGEGHAVSSCPVHIYPRGCVGSSSFSHLCHSGMRRCVGARVLPTPMLSRGYTSMYIAPFIRPFQGTVFGRQRSLFLIHQGSQASYDRATGGL